MTDQTPPASTRWDHDAPDEDDDLVPPYVPVRGSSQPSAGSTAPAEPAEAADTVEPVPAEPGDDPFPFETEPARETATGPGDAAPAEAPPSEAPPSDDAFPFETGGAATDDDAQSDDDFPAAAFDIEGEVPGGEEAGSDAGREPGSAAADAVAAELADRLETLAADLRERGEAAIDDELESADGFSRLLGAMLAGYLAGRGN